MTHPRPCHRLRRLPWLALAGLCAGPLAADEGHHHGTPPASAAEAALPRFAASSELFELVGVLEGRRLTLYLDHAPDNRPVEGARLELALAGQPLVLQPRGAGQFLGELPAAPQPGVVPVTATITAGAEADLLAGELDLHGGPGAEAATGGARLPTRWLLLAAGAAGAAGAALLAVPVLWWLRRRGQHPAPGAPA